ncbi:hypothetical protein V8J36_13475 [Frigidibacter sp. MR17.14]|uniref:hypothetical protein n=1 Tax=Frigidibacter sp. MR17.14 TaxID=3126509 RepID=UPI003012B738
MELDTSAELLVCDVHYEDQLYAAIADWARAPADLLHADLLHTTGRSTCRIHRLESRGLTWSAIDLRLVPPSLCHVCGTRHPPPEAPPLGPDDFLP